MDVEKAAEETLFILKDNVDGKVELIFRVNYLALINLHTDVEDTVAAINNIVSTEQKDILERDTLILLDARNWRFHLVACAAMLAGVNSEKLLNQLWSVLREGSWVSPQIAATTYLLDPRFNIQAIESISRENFNEQSIVALAQLLQQNPNTKFTEKQETRINSAKAKDSADSGKIAVSWAEKVHSLFIQ